MAVVSHSKKPGLACLTNVTRAKPLRLGDVALPEPAATEPARRRRSHRGLVLAMVSLLVLAGCVDLKPKPDPTRHFVLTATLTSVGSPIHSAAVRVASVQVPDYLRKPWLARRHANEIVYDPYAEWAEGLERGLSRVLTENLSRLPASTPGPARPNLSLSVEVRQFEIDENGAVWLVARWTLSPPPGTGPSQSGDFRKSRPAPSPDVAPAIVVGLLSELVGDLSEAVATAAEGTAARTP